MNTHTEKQIDLISYVRSNFRVSKDCGHYLVIECPFHSENTPSCAIYVDGYKCFGCGNYGSAYDFIYKIEGSKEAIRPYLVEKSAARHEKKLQLPPKFSLMKFNEFLLGDEEKLQYLYNRHFDYESVSASKIGHSGEYAPKWFKNNIAPRYSIPIYDSNKKHIITARYRIDPAYDDHTESKYLVHPRTNGILYNLHLLEAHDDIVIVGSDLDAAFLYYRYGIVAMSAPGEGVFKPEWGHLFTGKNVLIWLDYDAAGISGAIKMYNGIKPYGRCVRIYEWEGSYGIKDDVCDFVTKNSIKEFVQELKRYGIKAKSRLEKKV